MYMKYTVMMLLYIDLIVTIYRMDMDSLPLDHVDILLKNLPNDDEKKKFENYIKDKKKPDLLPPADKFLYEVCREGERRRERERGE